MSTQTFPFRKACWTFPLLTTESEYVKQTNISIWQRVDDVFFRSCDVFFLLFSLVISMNFKVWKITFKWKNILVHSRITNERRFLCLQKKSIDVCFWLAWWVTKMRICLVTSSERERLNEISSNISLWAKWVCKLSIIQMWACTSF